MEKFNWGGNGATLGRLSRTKIMFPINNRSKKPDYKYMEKYTKLITETKIDKYKQYAKKKLKEISYKKIKPLNSKEWKEFFITDIFPNIQRGKRLTKAKQKKGNMPYVSSTASNNGVDNFIGNTDKVRIFSNCITIANSGSVGASFYHPYEFVASDHVTHLKQEDMNEYIYLFITTMTNRFSEKYNFNREINDFRISREKILLPINTKKEPDYKYMEQYIKNMIHTKINKYLTYSEKE